MIITSDIHAEMGSVTIGSADETIIIAGDLSTYKAGNTNALLEQYCNQYKNVIFVPGNHDYWGTSVEQYHKDLVVLPNLHTLQNSSVTIDGQRYVGTTLWYPWSVDCDLYWKLFNDYANIEDFRPHEFNSAAIEFLSSEVTSDDIVITHHLPSTLSTPEQYKTGPFNCFFVSDMSELILDRQPKIWIHGHTHIKCNYHLGETHVICNPVGYPWE